MACQRVGRPALARQVLPLQCHRRTPYLRAVHLLPERAVLVVPRVALAVLRVVLAASAIWHATVAALR
jgi:hypothetical protein